MLAVGYYARTIDFNMYLLYTIAGAVFAHYVDPDMLDQHQVITYGEYRIKRHFGPIIFIFVYLWLWPLAKLLPHRSILSHCPPINTVVRLLYFGTPIYCLLYYFFYIEIDPNIIPYIIIGGIPVDVGHFLLDHIPFFKESKR